MLPNSSRDSEAGHNGQPELLGPFDFDPRTRVIFGSGAIDRLGQLAAELGGKRVLLVTDRGVEQAGHGVRGADSLQSAGLEVTIFDDVTPNPTTDDVERGLAVARSGSVDLIVGLGGGSSMDCAKGINFLLTNGGKMQDYRGIGKAKQPMLPMIAVPTTAGTGSEAQSFALIADPSTHVKMACGDKKAHYRIAVLDPDLTASVPAPVAAATGIDAISHAVESYVTRARNGISALFSRRAWQLLSAAFPRVIRNPNDSEARGAMLIGAHLAGAAIENSMLGATHSLANPLTARYGITHGVAIGIMLPHVVRYNTPAAGDFYTHLAADAGLGEVDGERAGELLAAHLESLVVMAGLPTTLDQWDIGPETIPVLAADAAAQWTAEFNPRPVDADSMSELYACAVAQDRCRSSKS